MRHSYIFYTIIGFVFISSCTKVERTFNIPSTYRFNSPSLVSKTIFSIDTGTGSIVELTKELGSFNRSNNEIADSINRIVKTQFTQVFLQSLTFISSNQLKLSFARIDTSKTLDEVIPVKDTTYTYSLSGNTVKIDDTPYTLFLDNYFEEIILCNEFTLRNQKTPNNTNIRKYYLSNCNSINPLESVKAIINKVPKVAYDTISVEYVHYIFSKY
jgi:hypothetical protein